MTLDNFDAPGEDLEEDDPGGEGGPNGIVDDEPSLGSFNGMINQEKSWRQREVPGTCNIDCEEDRADHEPSLAAANAMGPQQQILG